MKKDKNGVYKTPQDSKKTRVRVSNEEIFNKIINLNEDNENINNIENEIIFLNECIIIKNIPIKLYVKIEKRIRYLNDLKLFYIAYNQINKKETTATTEDNSFN